MAVDKLVDSTQLDSDLTSVANAIRTKGGTSASLAFPAGFVSAIQAISGGGITPEVPSGYTQLKYVESSGTQIIDTGVVPTLETKVQIVFFFLSGTYSGYCTPTGCANPSVSITAKNSQAGGASYWSFGNKGDFAQLSPYWATDTVPTYTLDKTRALIEQDCYPDRTTTCGATTMSGSSHIGIFGRYNGTTKERMCPIRFYREKIWDNGVLLRDFLPAMEDATEKIGLYDIVNNVFYENQGTGVFTGETY